MLIDITVNGQPVKALAQPTKQSIFYVFNRVTGHPILPIEEKPVPQGDVPGRMVIAPPADSSQTPPCGRNGFSVDDVIDFTPELKAAGAAADFEIQDRTTFHAPGGEQGRGTAGHAGIGCFREHQLGGRIVRSADPPLICVWQVRGGEPRAGAARGGRVGYEFRPWLYRFRGCAAACRGRRPSSGWPCGWRAECAGLPLFKPPYGAITAFDMNKGEIVWHIARGETPDNVRNNPALKGVNIPRTGRAGNIGLVTGQRWRGRVSDPFPGPARRLTTSRLR